MLALRDGDRINNYLLESRIGAGSFGEVWRARHHVFGDVVAIKIPTDAEYVRNLQREGVAVHGLQHPNIVRAIDLDPYADPPYFVMEYVDGPSLRAVIDAHGKGLPGSAITAIMQGILQALCAAHHHGVIHRDLKPANILLHRPPSDVATLTEQAVKVTDFGLGHVGGTTTQSLMQSGSLLTEEGRSIAGTLAYMSPEQKEGRDLDPRSDLYACGIILFELLTGSRPEGSELPSSLRPGIASRFDEVFRRCYTRRERRYGSAQAMLSALSGPPGTATARAGSDAARINAGGVPLGDGTGRCPACRHPVHREDQFCIHCGRQLVAAVPRCPSCQAYVRASDHYCIFCGNDLRVLSH